MTATMLFDLDGTLVETDPLHFQAFHRTFAEHGVEVDWETYRTRIIGKANPAIAAEFLPHVDVAHHPGIMDRKEAAYRDLATTLEPVHGLMDLLAWAERAGIPCAVVTNAPRANAELALKALNLETRFAALVIGAELSDSKPHPLPYLRALELLGGDAAHSVAFEDSPSGAMAAVAAKLAVVGMLTSVEPALLKGAGVHLMARSFTDPAVLDLVKRRTGAGA